MNRRVALFAGGTACTVAATIAYDYKTQHPMRQMGPYSTKEAGIRTHNNLRHAWNFPPLSGYSLSDIAPYNGKDQKPVYFSANGLVYDVTSSDKFDTAYAMWKGKDASFALAKMSMDASDVNRTDWSALTKEDMDSLNSWTRYFNEKYMIKGRLKEFDSN